MAPKLQRTPAEVQLVQELYYEPLEFVLALWPWSKEGTMLRAEEGPDEWQAGFLKELGQELYNRREQEHFVIQEAVAAGHSVGKSAFAAWINFFFITTRPLLRGTVTANTENQLKTKTWAELYKWHSIFKLKHWLNISATRLSMAGADEMWRIDSIPWSEKNSEAFAGLHAAHVLVQFDEASAIPNVIHEVTEGAVASGCCVWLQYGNPTRRTGKFRENLSNPKWHARHIDARTAKKANQDKIEDWKQEYGEDSDFFRVRVRGLPPQQSSNQLIPDDIISAAVDRHVDVPKEAPVVVAVDVARYGDDFTKIYARKGLKAWCAASLSGADTETVADETERVVLDENADKLVIDASAPGVIDVLRRRGYEVIEANFSRPVLDEESYNKRAQMYCRVRDALRAGLSIPDIKELREDLAVQQYLFKKTKRGDRKLLIDKKDLKVELGRSPDDGDALVMTYYETEFKLPEGRNIQRVAMPQIVREFDALSH